MEKCVSIPLKFRQDTPLSHHVVVFVVYFRDSAATGKRKKNPQTAHVTPEAHVRPTDGSCNPSASNASTECKIGNFFVPFSFIVQQVQTSNALLLP